MSDVMELKWKRQEADIWNDNEAVEEELLKDTYTIQFKPHEDYEDIDDVTVDLLPNQLNVVEVSTKRKAETGSIKINIFPETTSTEGVKWRVKNTTSWLNSGDTTSNILIGLKEIEFQLNEFTEVKEPLKLNVLKNHLTEVDFILTLTGEPINIIEDILISSISEPTCVKRIPDPTYNITFSGVTNIIIPEEVIVNYGSTATVNFIAGYKFKKGGIVNDITYTDNIIQNLTETSLTTGKVFNDAQYSFNVQWIKSNIEEVGINATEQFSLSKSTGKPKQLEDICILSASESSLQIRKAYLESKLEEAVGEKLISVKMEKRVFKLSETSYDSVHVSADQTIDLKIKNLLKNRSVVTDPIGVMSDVVANVFIKDKRKTGSLKESVVFGSDVVAEVFKSTVYRSFTLKEDLSILSNDLLNVDKYTPNMNKNVSKEDIGITSITESSLSKHNVKFLTINSGVEEIGITSADTFSMEKSEKENKVNLSVEEIGIESNDNFTVDLTTKIFSKTLTEEIGIESNDNFTVDIINKELKYTASEELGVTSNTVETVEIKTTNAIKSKTDESIAIVSNNYFSIDVHDSRYTLNKQSENIGSISLVTSTLDRKDPRYNRNTSVEDIGILSNSSFVLDKKGSVKSNIFKEEVAFLCDTVLKVEKYKKMERLLLSDLDIGILAPVSFDLDIISHLKKGKLSTEDIGMITLNETSIDRKSHLVKNEITEAIGFTSNTVDKVDIQVKSLTSTTTEEVSILSNIVDVVERKSHLVKDDFTEEIGIESNDNFTVDLTTKIFSKTLTEEIGVTSDEALSLTKETKTLSNTHQEDIGILSTSFLSVDKNTP